MLTVHAIARTDIGQVRARNEDSFLIDHNASLYAVADGMGGHAAGDVASQTAIAALAAAFQEAHDLQAAIETANRAVIERAQTESDKTGMGTTLTAVHIAGDTLHAAHVGDSRLYRLRAARLTQLTRDHTVAQDMIDEGALSKEAAMQHPASSMLKRALGSRADVQIDLIAEPLQPADLLLLCTDGLTGMLNDSSIEQVLVSDADLDHRARQLIREANRRGGVDNITALLLQIAR